MVQWLAAAVWLAAAPVPREDVVQSLCLSAICVEVQYDRVVYWFKTLSPEQRAVLQFSRVHFTRLCHTECMHYT